MYTDVNSIVEISGKPVTSTYKALSPGAGKTILTLTSTRIIEQTRRRWMGTRYCEAPLARIDSVAIEESGNLTWLVIGMSTLWIWGIGIIFILLFFLLRKKYLIVWTGNNMLALTIESSMEMERARLFIDEVIKLIDH